MPRKTSRAGAGAYYEDRARQRKAFDFGEYLFEQGIDADKLALLNPAQVTQHAAMAGIKNPSPETMALVHNHLQAKARNKAKFDDPNYDPFAGM